jgi:ABC-type uncharacterized transport system substrate-binding protein
MRNWFFTWLALALPLMGGGAVSAQQAVKMSHIGYLDAPNAAADPGRVEALRQGLRELGYIEGKNIVIEFRFADGKLDRLPALAGELVRHKVDVIVTGGPTSTHAAKTATSTIPIVMSQDSDPVGNGFVASLARPGGNITGLSSLNVDLSGKRLELLKEILPKLERVAILGTSTSHSSVRQQRETELAAAAFKVKIQYWDVLTSKDIEPVFKTASKEHVDGVIQLAGPVVAAYLDNLPRVAAKNRLPVIYYQSAFIEHGGLMSYGPHWRDLDHRVATYIDKILKGAKPADLPVEQPTKFEFIINLKAAKQIGLTIPPNVLARADRVIR